MRRLIVGAVAGAHWRSRPAALAYSGPRIVIDEDSVDNTTPAYWTGATPGVTGHTWSASDVNDDIPGKDQRSVLRFFANNQGTTIWIATGTTGDPGWWQLTSIPDGPSPSTLDWSQLPPHDSSDGWENLFTAQEGLGTSTPDCSDPGPKVVYADGSCASEDPEALLDKVPNVSMVGVDDSNFDKADSEWNSLVNQYICAVVKDGDVSRTAENEASLKGDYRGVAAFTVLQVVNRSSNLLPYVQIRIESNAGCDNLLAVEFQMLRATRYGRSVQVRWTTASEVDTLGYNVFRSIRGKRIKMNKRLIPAGSLVGNAAGPHAYSLRARLSSARAAAQSRYWIQEIELDGTRNWYGPVRAVSAT